MARDVLLKLARGSAEGSMRHLASVWRGSFDGRDRRACRAESLAEWTARRWEGAYRGVGVLVAGVGVGFVSPPSAVHLKASSGCNLTTLDALRRLVTCRRTGCHWCCRLCCTSPSSLCSTCVGADRVSLEEKAQRCRCNRGLRGGCVCICAAAHLSIRTRFIRSLASV